MESPESMLTFLVVLKEMFKDYVELSAMMHMMTSLLQMEILKVLLVFLPISKYICIVKVHILIVICAAGRIMNTVQMQLSSLLIHVTSTII